MAQVGLVVVSHSRALADAAVGLAREMLHGSDLAVEVAAGVDGGFGTDAAEILSAVVAADSGDGVVVLMDLGSAVLSAELAVELLDEEQRARVVLCPAPLVEGLVVAAVSAAGGAAREQVAQEALGGLAAKQAHLGGGGADAAEDEGPPAAGFVVREEHGLHARPAARLVQVASASGASVEVRNATTGSGWVPASSLSQVAALGALRGHRVEVRASGPGADDAVAAVLALDAPADEVRVVVGPARVLPPVVLDVPTTPSGSPDEEWQRLEAARAATREDLVRTRTAAAEALGEQEAAVFDAHLLLLDDADLVDEARRRTQAGEAAGAAWAAAVDRGEAVLAALESPYLQARAADVRAVGDAVLRALLGVRAPSADVEGVLVADDLTAAQAALLDPRRTVGVVLARGSADGHAAQLAQATGVPVVVQAGAQVLQVADGTRIALAGGRVVVDPDDAAVAALREG